MSLIPPAQLRAFVDEVNKLAGMAHPAEIASKKVMTTPAPNAAASFKPAELVPPAPPVMA